MLQRASTSKRRNGALLSMASGHGTIGAIKHKSRTNDEKIDSVERGRGGDDQRCDTRGAGLLLATVVLSSPLASSCIRPISRGLSLGKMTYKLIIKIFSIYVCMGSNLEAPKIF